MIRVFQGRGDDWRYRGAMTWLQNKKHQGLIKDGLSPIQAREFIWYKFGQAYMRRFRNAIRRGEAGATKASAWAIWRKYFNDAQKRKGQPGGYTPPQYDPSKPHKKLTTGGKVDTGYTSEYERNRRARGKGKGGVAPVPSRTKEDFIKGLEQTLEGTTDPKRRRQLQQQINNLRESM